MCSSIHIWVLKAGFIASFFILLSACGTAPQTLALTASPPDSLPRQSSIKSVPFYAQKKYFCGPTALAEVFNFYGAKQTPEKLAPSIFIPELEGSLQIEMAAATRKYHFLPYADNSNLKQLLALVSDGMPVIVLQNLSIPWIPAWHYAVVTGYDLQQQTIRLHSGDIKHYEMDLSVFERTWQRANFWLLAVVPPDKSSRHFNSFIYTKAAQDLIDVGKIDSGVMALQQASKQWPDQWLAYFLLGNYYLNLDPMRAYNWYQKGYPYGQYTAAYLNNFAYLMGKLGCNNEARQLINQALAIKPDDPNLQDTYQSIDKKLNQSMCPIVSGQ
ncbi:PA2778 family cysteine peptidase [Pleionea mediterranea]|uniref:Peptidase C39-like protein n=1 Tax=Pleionea mediterranea TaxID=523701 RepID=A0A316FXU3_9GAMM|nr:PA2778 family cysteine peptidase [Pleionea mediterranea]PWK52925.1 peptidase C39-like protein [Pleionea mediterranea]